MDELLHLRPTCGAVVVSKKEMSAQGSQMCVTLNVKTGKNIWKSEPKLKGMAARNLLLPLVIPLSGATYTKMALSEIVNLKISGKRQLTTFKT